MPPTTPLAKRAFSYLRFSTPDQLKGNSFKRQLDLARKYAEQHGFDLDENLTFRDLGVSAFRGRNVVEGALGQFIKAVDAGRVPRGSYLLVENIDRLSRDKILAALELIQSLLKRGINVVTLSDGKVYTPDSLNNISDLIVFLAQASRANEESEMKSRRIKTSWANKRTRAATEGHLLTSKAPAWLKLNNEVRTFDVIEDRASVVRRIFSMALDGYGKAAIAQRLNSDSVEPFGNGPAGARKADGWHPSYVQKILDSEAVVGQFQPMRIVFDPKTGRKSREPDGPLLEKYYPAVVDRKVFHRVRQLRRTRRTVSGPKGETFSNLLSGLITCGYCGGPVHYINKGNPPKGGVYFTCSSARRKHGDCTAPSIRHGVVLEALFNSLNAGDLDVRTLLHVDGKDGRKGLQEMRADLDAISDQVSENQRSMEHLLDVLQRQPSPAIETRLQKLEADGARLRADKERLEVLFGESSAAAESRTQDFEDVATLTKAWNEMAAKTAKDPALAYDLNVRINGALKKIIQAVAVGRGDSAREWLLDFMPRVPIPKRREVVRIARNLMDGFQHGVSFSVKFRHAPDRFLIIYADGRNKGRFVSAAVRGDESTGKFNRVRFYVSGGR